jgi:uncharacterized protein YutE (UPF0331/DUF86 family)
MAARTEQLERERLLKLAEEYRQKGYEVILSPKPEDMPNFLKGYSPDMIVRRGEEAVVIEVKSRSSITTAQYLRDLAQVVGEHPGWRVELVMTNPEDVGYIANVEGSLQEHEIKSQLQVARELAERHPESAILYAWSLAEATLRLVANHEGINLQKLEAPLRLLKQLATEGIISKSEYETLMNASQSRSAIAHGFKTTLPTQISVLELLEITEQLLNSLNTGEQSV